MTPNHKNVHKKFNKIKENMDIFVSNFSSFKIMEKNQNIKLCSEITENSQNSYKFHNGSLRI